MQRRKDAKVFGVQPSGTFRLPSGHAPHLIDQLAGAVVVVSVVGLAISYDFDRIILTSSPAPNGQ
jgi:hypothetical protein